MDEIEGKRKELDTLIEQSSSYLVKCYECPLQTPCSLSDPVLASRAETLARIHVQNYGLDDAIDTLEAMRKIGQNCHLLNGCYHVPEEGE